MVAELVETSRLWGRDAARIDPKWVEPLAEHLVQRTYSEPRWVASRASVVATERVTLYGLPIVTGRTVAVRPDRPGALARAVHPPRAGRGRLGDPARRSSPPTRRCWRRSTRSSSAPAGATCASDDEALFAFYDERIPADVVSGAHFDRWWRDERRADPDLLTYTRGAARDRRRRGRVDRAGRPARWKQGELVLPLSYRFEPGAEHDGVTVHVPLKALPQLRAAGFDWLVPAFRLELVTALIRSLPKDARRRLVPVPEVAAEVLARLRPRKGRFADAVAARARGAARRARHAARTSTSRGCPPTCG